MILKELPLRLIHRLIITSRRLYFNVSIPNTDGFVVNKSIREIENVFSMYRWEDGSIPSYYYQGEDLNLRRPAGKKENVYYQEHCRFFETKDNKVWFISHYEPSPFTNPHDHIHENGFSWEEGRDRMNSFLKFLDWDYNTKNKKEVNL